jgi:uncharacterized protein (DUF302 family)
MSIRGFVVHDSANDFSTTLSRLTSALVAKGLTIFAVVDHADGAEIAGLELRPTTLVIFGNAKGGTPLMQAAQTVGIDLPLKALVWQDAKGIVHLGYNDPAWIAERHALGDGAHDTVAALSAALSALAAHAASRG